MGQQLPDEVRERIDKLTASFREQLEAVYIWGTEAAAGEAPLAMQIEERIRQWTRQIGADTQALVLSSLDRYQRKGKRPCPRCGQEVYWKAYAVRQYITSLGELQLERAYYHHGACHCGWVPLDEKLGLGASELSPLVQEMVSYLGAFMPFERAQEYLGRYHDIHISHDVVNSTTARVGNALAEQQTAEIQQVWESSELPACAVATPPQRLYVSADGIHHLLPHGEGREIKVAAIYETTERRNQQGVMEPHAVNIEYVVASDPEELARAAYLAAVKRGAEFATEIIVLGDGANWIWNRIPVMFPPAKVTEVGDFYHASEYLWKVAHAVWRENPAQAKTWGEEQCHTLKHNGPETVLQALHALEDTVAALPEPVTQALTYFENQGVRMAYHQYVQRGLQIGSGSIESGVKQVVGSRVNQPGMRWAPEHADAVAHVRAAILSQRWDDFWADFHPPPRQYQRHQVPLAA